VVDRRHSLHPACKKPCDLEERRRVRHGHHDVPAEFLFMPEEGHSLDRKPSAVVIYHEAVLAFLNHNVLGKAWVQPALLG
jgi:predicted dienelactone hydrolase